MRPFARAVSAGLAATAIILADGRAMACQPPPAKSMQEQLNEAVAVVRAKVMAAEVKTVEDLGIECVSVICDILQVRLEILESFKGNPDDYVTIYAPVPMMCVPMIIPGWEYVLFLEENKGYIWPNEYSIGVHTGRPTPEVIELRNLTAP